jgi:hypothetical protein
MPNCEPVKITVEEKVYTIAVDSIGTTQNALHRAYCDVVISWD